MLFIVKKHISQSSSMPPETAISEFCFFMRNDSWNYFSWRGFMLVEVHLNPPREYIMQRTTHVKQHSEKEVQKAASKAFQFKFYSWMI